METPSPSALRVPAPVLEEVRGYAASAYPEECCGAMLGRDGNGTGAERRVVRVVPVRNRWAGRGGRRFLIGAADVWALGARAEDEGLALVGFYHSHPGAPPEPSALDREHAWPWYSYLIVSVRAGRSGEARSWRLADDRSAFLPEHLCADPEGT